MELPITGVERCACNISGYQHSTVPCAYAQDGCARKDTESGKNMMEGLFIVEVNVKARTIALPLFQ